MPRPMITGARLRPALFTRALRSALTYVCALACAALAVAASIGRTAEGWREQEISGDRTKATFAIPGQLPSFGFAPVLVTIDNREAQDIAWPATFRASGSSETGFHVLETALPLTAPGLRTNERWVFVPLAGGGINRLRYSGRGIPVGAEGLSIHVSDTGAEFPNANFRPSYSSRNNDMVPWAVSASLHAEVRTRVLAVPAPPVAARPGRPRPPVGRLVSGDINLTAIDFSRASPDWRIWSPFRRVVLGADEYLAMPAANREALRGWVALGGYLYLAPAQAGAVREEPHGAGRIVTLGAPISDAASDAAGLFTAPALLQSTPGLPWKDILALPADGLAQKVPGAAHVGDWLIYFFIGFALLIAPLNLYVFAPQRRRHWMFFTVPAISLLAVVALGGAIFLQDGTGGTGARRALVVLLPGDNQAAVFQEQVTRTGMVFDSGFALADDTLCAVMETSDVQSRPTTPLRLTRQDGEARGEWFRSRVRQAHHLRRLTPTRARVERVGQSPDGAPILQSTVEAALRDVLYFDATGAAWTAPQISPGAKVTLTRLTAPADLLQRAKAFGDEGSAYFSALVREATQPNAPHRFIARVDDGELAPLPTLASIRWTDTQVLLAGTAAPPAGGGGRP